VRRLKKSPYLEGFSIRVYCLPVGVYMRSILLNSIALCVAVFLCGSAQAQQYGTSYRSTVTG
jgi:hypothetical protein